MIKDTNQISKNINVILLSLPFNIKNQNILLVTEYRIHNLLFMKMFGNLQVYLLNLDS